MKNLRFYLFGIIFLINSLSACPDCTGKVGNQSPSYFDEELYLPTHDDPAKYNPGFQYFHQLKPYPYQYQLSPDEQPSLNVDNDDQY